MTDSYNNEDSIQFANLNGLRTKGIYSEIDA